MSAWARYMAPYYRGLLARLDAEGEARCGGWDRYREQFRGGSCVDWARRDIEGPLAEAEAELAAELTTYRQGALL